MQFLVAEIIVGVAISSIFGFTAQEFTTFILRDCDTPEPFLKKTNSIKSKSTNNK